MRQLKLFVSVLVVVSACQNTSTTDSGDSDDSSNSEVVSSIGLVGQAMSSTAAREFIDDEERDVETRATACNSLSFSSCDSTTKTKTRTFSTDAGDTGGCTRGSSSQLTVFGKATLTFSLASCAETTGGTITRTLSNHYFTESSGRKVLMYTDSGTVAGISLVAADLKDYGGTSRSGGSILTVGAGSSDTLVINGIHRRAVRATGKYGFWHTLYTDSTGLTLTRSGGTRTISSGTMYVAHNRAKILVTQSFSNVAFSPDTCCYPTSGTITNTLTPLTGTATSFQTVFSSTCGGVTIDGTSATLPSCTN